MVTLPPAEDNPCLDMTVRPQQIDRKMREQTYDHINEIMWT